MIFHFFPVSAVVLCSFLLSMPPLIGWSEYVYTPTHSFCFADWTNHMSYAFFMIGCCFGVPFGVMTVCNVFIIRSVRRSRLRVKANNRNSSVSGMYSSGNFGRVGSRFPSKFEDNECYSGIESSFSEMTKPKDDSTLTRNDEKSASSENDSAENNNVNRKEKNQVTVSIAGDSEKSKSTLDRFSDASETDINSCLITHKSSDKVSIEKTNLRKVAVAPIEVNGFRDSKPRELPKDPNLLHPAWQAGLDEELATSISVTVESNSEMTITLDQPSAGRESTIERVPRRRRGSPLLRRREEIRLAFSLVVVVVIFVICWLPYCISMLISVFYKGHVPREFHMFTLVIGYANSGCNPIVYGVMNKRFKVGFKRLFCFWKQTELSFSST